MDSGGGARKITGGDMEDIKDKLKCHLDFNVLITHYEKLIEEKGIDDPSYLSYNYADGTALKEEFFYGNSPYGS